LPGEHIILVFVADVFLLLLLFWFYFLVIASKQNPEI